MDTDLIIVQAHREELADLANYKGKRNTRRIKLEQKLKDRNMTTADLPRICVTKISEEWIWNRTLEAQKMFSHYPLSEKELRSQFDISRKKWCDVDERAVLRKSTW